VQIESVNDAPGEAAMPPQRSPCCKKQKEAFGRAGKVGGAGDGGDGGGAYSPESQTEVTLSVMHVPSAGQLGSHDAALKKQDEATNGCASVGAGTQA
jgi:hypothetical protein